MENKIITTSRGKIFKRKSDGLIYGKKINLGYTYYINNQKLEIPHLETADDFEQIDEPEREEFNIGGNE